MLYVLKHLMDSVEFWCKGMYNGSVYIVSIFWYLQKTPPSGQETVLSSSRQTTARARAPRRTRRPEGRCTGWSRRTRIWLRARESSFFDARQLSLPPHLVNRSLAQQVFSAGARSPLRRAGGDKSAVAAASSMARSSTANTVVSRSARRWRRRVFPKRQSAGEEDTDVHLLQLLAVAMFSCRLHWFRYTGLGMADAFVACITAHRILNSEVPLLFQACSWHCIPVTLYSRIIACANKFAPIIWLPPLLLGCVMSLFTLPLFRYTGVLLSPTRQLAWCKNICLNLMSKICCISLNTMSSLILVHTASELYMLSRENVVSVNWA